MPKNIIIIEIDYLFFIRGKGNAYEQRCEKNPDGIAVVSDGFCFNADSK